MNSDGEQGASDNESGVNPFEKKSRRAIADYSPDKGKKQNESNEFWASKISGMKSGTGKFGARFEWLFVQLFISY